MAKSGQSRGLNRDSRASRSHCVRSLSLTRVGTWTRRTTYKSPRPPPPFGNPWLRTRSFWPFCSGRNLDVYSATQRWHRHLCAEYGFPRREVQIEIQIVAFDAVIRVFREANAQEQIACRSATHSCFAAPRQAELLPFAH